MLFRSVGYFGAAEAGEEEGAVEVVGHGAVHRHRQRAEGGPRAQHAHQEALSDAQLCVDVAGPARHRGGEASETAVQRL